MICTHGPRFMPRRNVATHKLSRSCSPGGPISNWDAKGFAIVWARHVLHFSMANNARRFGALYT